MVLRLVDTTTLTLTEHRDPQNIPHYAILSHTWGNDDEEVTFQDILNANGKPPASIARRPGYLKLVCSCTIARASGFKYIWIDTCCINKQSSAELSEAINSMYRYYRDAQVCYVALADVPSDEDPTQKESAFRKSRWFTRGWTLQELVAPLSVIFYASDWLELGTKSSLQDVIRDVTGIPSVVLLVNYPGEIGVAKRMSWAAKRETKYVEDMAYSLMGIFGVNMPTLYGEGPRAFLRLQQEIIKTSDDQSILAW
ncbi:HET-domain-containing protein, partial [Heliocybe sulcata]